jgi:hypothetical protein
MKILFLFLLLTPFVKAQTNESTQILKSENPVEKSVISNEKNVQVQIPASVVLSGDFRYRLQSETQEPKETRKLQRIQVRLQAAADVQENLKVNIRLMTGTAANSGNQTLGDEKAPGMVRRNFGLDHAFFDYTPYSDLNLMGGRMPQPLTFVGKNQLILDRDIALEGLAAKIKIPLEQNFLIFAQGGFFMVRENYDSLFSEDQSDNVFNAAQIGLQFKKDDEQIILGVGSMSFTGLKDTPPVNLTAGGGANGNTLDLTGNYPANFDLEEYFIEYKNKFKDFEILLFLESVLNKDLDTLNKAQSYGLQGTYKKWSLSWAQQKVEKDAVVGLFTDSDFAGGQTSSRGVITSLNYKMTKKVQLQYTVFNNANSIETFSAKYNRSHVDLMISF